MKKQPVLDGKIEQCKHCGRDGYPYFGNVPPAILVNYILLNHAAYLKDAVLKNIDFLNSVFDMSGKILKAENPLKRT